MDFEKGDYLINIEKMKAIFFDELSQTYTDSNDVKCPIDTRLRVMNEIIITVERLGQKMGG